MQQDQRVDLALDAKEINEEHDLSGRIGVFFVVLRDCQGTQASTKVQETATNISE